MFFLTCTSPSHLSDCVYLEFSWKHSGNGYHRAARKRSDLSQHRAMDLTVIIWFAEPPYGSPGLVTRALDIAHFRSACLFFFSVQFSSVQFSLVFFSFWLRSLFVGPVLFYVRHIVSIGSSFFLYINAVFFPPFSSFLGLRLYSSCFTYLVYGGCIKHSTDLLFLSIHKKCLEHLFLHVFPGMDFGYLNSCCFPSFFPNICRSARTINTL